MHALLHAVPPTVQQATAVLTTPPDTPGHSSASLGQCLVGSLFLSPGSWWAQGFICALQDLYLQSCVSFGGLMVGLMATSSYRSYAIPRPTAPRAPAPAAVHCSPIRPQEALKHSSVLVSVLVSGSWYTKICLNPLSISGGYGV